MIREWIRRLKCRLGLCRVRMIGGELRNGEYWEGMQCECGKLMGCQTTAGWARDHIGKFGL